MIRCVRCGRLLSKAAATVPAVDTGPTPHPAGAMGPKCAQRAGLLPPSLFERRRAVKVGMRTRTDSRQMELSA